MCPATAGAATASADDRHGGSDGQYLPNLQVPAIAGSTERNTIDAQPLVSPAEARSLLDQADRISRQAHESTRWPYITFILAPGVSTSLGALVMGLTTGSAFGMAYFGTLTVSLALIVFFDISIQGRAAVARSRRWSAYIASWVVTYAAEIIVVVWVHGSMLWSGITSGLILVVTMACAAYEARR